MAWLTFEEISEKYFMGYGPLLFWAFLPCVQNI